MRFLLVSFNEELKADPKEAFTAARSLVSFNEELKVPIHYFLCHPQSGSVSFNEELKDLDLKKHFFINPVSFNEELKDVEEVPLGVFELRYPLMRN